MTIDPPVPLDTMMPCLHRLAQLYQGILCEEIDWAFVLADVQAGTFPRPGALYVREEE